MGAGVGTAGVIFWPNELMSLMQFEWEGKLTVGTAAAGIPF